jgi:DNA polymerase-3 subunit delta'
MNFSQIPGQKDIISKLVRSVHEQKVSHAQLFAGPEGCGAFALALAYARFINCENRNGEDSCGSCKSCIKYEKLIHPDLHFVFPVIKGKKATDPVSDTYIEQWRSMAGRIPFFTIKDWMGSIDTGNSQGMIYTAEAAEIIKKLNLKSFESDFKIMIIWLPEKMNQTTSNKLLKLIEEPPEKTLFLLVSEEPDKIIPTIISRCQIVRIPAFPAAEIEKYLIDKYSIAPGKAADFARISGGNISRAVALCNDEEGFAENLERFKQLMRFAWKKDVLSLISWSEDLAGTGRETQKNFALFSLRLLRENYMLSLGQDKNKIIYLSDQETAFSEKFHSFIHQDNIQALNDEFNLACSHVEANGNAKIIFLDLALRIARLIR